jgi:hypothetical protein
MVRMRLGNAAKEWGGPFAHSKAPGSPMPFTPSWGDRRSDFDRDLRCVGVNPLAPLADVEPQRVEPLSGTALGLNPALGTGRQPGLVEHQGDAEDHNCPGEQMDSAGTEGMLREDQENTDDDRDHREDAPYHVVYFFYFFLVTLRLVFPAAS